MRLLSVIVAFLAAGALAVYVLTCSVNNTPPAPVHPIVGKWVQVTQNGRPVVPGLGMVIDYRPDGVVVFTALDGGAWTEEHGHYTPVGNSMTVIVPTRVEHRQFRFDFTWVTPNKLASADTSMGGVEEYARMAD